MELVIGLGVGVVVFGVAVVLYLRSHAADDEARRMERARVDAILAANSAEAQQRKQVDATAEPLVAPPGYRTDLVERMREVVARFDTLSTFQDVERWDADAVALCGQIAEEHARVDSFVEATGAAIELYRAEDDDPAPVKSARLRVTREHYDRACREADALREFYDQVMERVDMTPNTKKEQSAVLRELRADKKELQLRKREVKSAATEIRREARVASANAGRPPSWMFGTYSPGVAAIERRAIRKQREAELMPHENAAAALDRQIMAIDRRINWVARFGEAEQE